jgi:hypothetical protein
MKRTFKNNLRLILGTIGFTIFFNFGFGQSPADQISSLSWAVATNSAGINDSNNIGDENLAITIRLKDLEGTDSFTLLLTDDNENALYNIGEYHLKKHENGFYYVEEKNSKEMSTVFNNEIYFLVPVKHDKASKMKMVSLKVKSKDKSSSGADVEMKIKAKVPKVKKK